jgi:excisionase family DNA binding protein
MKETRKDTVVSGKLAVSIAEAAGMLDLCTKTVRHLIAMKELPSRRVGRRVLIRVADLENFLRHDHLAIKRQRRGNGKATEATEVVEAVEAA